MTRAAPRRPSLRSPIRREPLIAAVLVAALLGVTAPASAFISANTIDRHATYRKNGTHVRTTGPIGCSRGERISIRITITQRATGGWARQRWTARCTGELQHWQVRARARHRTRFASGAGKVCAAARTRVGGRVTDTRTWCEPVAVSAGF